MIIYSKKKSRKFWSKLCGQIEQAKETEGVQISKAASWEKDIV